MSSFWSDRRVLLTGGNGFLGSFASRRSSSLRRGANSAAATRSWLREHRPNLIIHGAAVVGGIGANRMHPGLFFYENAVMGIHLIEEARLAGVEKFVCLGTICAYPKFAPIPFPEEDLWNGYPEETNAPYGVAKKALLVQLQAYRDEYGFNGVFLLPVNLYGPGDNFDLETSHVIPAMIRKFVEARTFKEGSLVLLGDGSPTRQFLYVEDAADGIVAAAEAYDNPEPVNLGRGEEVAISDVTRPV